MGPVQYLRGAKIKRAINFIYEGWPELRSAIESAIPVRFVRLDGDAIDDVARHVFASLGKSRCRNPVSVEIRCLFIFSGKGNPGAPAKSGVSSSFRAKYDDLTPDFLVFRARMMNCRVGKGRPAGSIELRVSPSPSKIPYGGFSPVRLQMDRQWRPSTTSRGLSAVHIRPMTPSYTPPQFSLPGIRDPQGITRSRAFRFNMARLPATPTRPSRGPWLAIGLCCPDGSSLTTASSETLNPSPPLMNSRRRLLHQRKTA